jgi:hypothetical protein
MKVIKYALTGVALVAVVTGGLVIRGGQAGAVVTPQAAVYAPAQAITQYFGSKHAVGYFLQQNGSCAMTVLISEDTDGRTSPSATRMQFSMRPGETAELQSVETQTLEVTCGANASTIEVRNGNFQSAYVLH